MLCSAPLKRKEKSKEDSNHDARKNARITVATFIINCFTCFGRIGCFLGGCCYGVESEHGVVFTDSLIESANGVPRVPVQLYEAVFELALFFALWALLNKGVLKNRLLLVYLFSYAVGRFILEFWRGDEYRGFLFGLSTSQVVSILVFAVSAVLFIVKPKKKAENA